MAGTNRYYRGPPSDHFDGLRFFNPGQPATDRTLAEVLRWKLARTAVNWSVPEAVRQVEPEPRLDGLRITMVGHATLLIQGAGLNVLTDPVWSDRASPLTVAGPRRATVPGIAFERLPPIDVVLLSHNHYDHFDVDTLRRLHARHRPLIVTPLGNDAIVRRHVPDARIAVGDWGDRFELGDGAEVHIVPANHWSSRGLSDRRMALWAGFVLRFSSAQVYFAGDTGYGNGQIFRAIQAQHGSPDIALIPIGAYAPRWFMSAQHVDPEEAVSIMLDLDAGHAIGIHWGTFRLTDEAREEPAIRLRQILQSRGIEGTRFEAAVPGSVFNLP